MLFYCTITIIVALNSNLDTYLHNYIGSLLLMSCTLIMLSHWLSGGWLLYSTIYHKINSKYYLYMFWKLISIRNNLHV